MNRKEKMDKLAKQYMDLQDLDIKPTIRNMEILLSTLYAMTDVYNLLEEEERNEQSRQETDPGECDGGECGSRVLGQDIDAVVPGDDVCGSVVYCPEQQQHADDSL